MYITYCRNQKSVDLVDTTSYRLNVTGQVVKKDDDAGDEYDLIDNGEHCIVEKYEIYKDKIIRPVEWMTDSESDEQEVEVEEKCNTYIDYLWYDKVCIDQHDEEAKLNEIRQMHNIYRNARFTIAIISEIALYNPDDFEHEDLPVGHRARYYSLNDMVASCWWTLEEVMMSKRILIVGTDTNMFQHNILSDALLDFGGSQGQDSVNQALSFAHFQTSTKSHDMIFALKNTFAHMFEEMEISYSTDIQTTFNKFYQHIATVDLSILCFGSNSLPNGDINQEHTIHSYTLPSWTGTAGAHVDRRVTATTHSELTWHTDEATIYNDDCTNMVTADKNTVLMEWVTNIRVSTDLFMTHYHQPQGDGSPTKLRPLSLTEDCTECILLPILLQLHAPAHRKADGTGFNVIIDDYGYCYCLPVVRVCTNKGANGYKTIGIYYLGDGEDYFYEPTFKWKHCDERADIKINEPNKEIINTLFENY
ncbi:hypothetical protein INT45_012994 [Circinella minor]|uniref:Heterokaryon incompatibility domain-containing protein n=1 Tax=Circinella minor TaxID=1195481 RepID=A0A8H7RVX3_9FUNG|nr:hypothetical protein INT45_012994 [Circinella minor]